MRQVRRDTVHSFVFHPWHDGRTLVEDGHALYLTGPDGCSCSEWHRLRGEAPCTHQKALGEQLLLEAERLTSRVLALLGKEPWEGAQKLP